MRNNQGGPAVQGSITFVWSCMSDDAPFARGCLIACLLAIHSIPALGHPCDRVQTIGSKQSSGAAVHTVAWIKFADCLRPGKSEAVELQIY